jgi:hypothetical protein
MPSSAINVLGDTLEPIPLVGNLFSLTMAGYDIYKPDGLTDYYKNCMAGKN